MTDDQFRDALMAAFRKAIADVGLDAFKAISWFPSNQQKHGERVVARQKQNG